MCTSNIRDYITSNAWVTITLSHLIYFSSGAVIYHGHILKNEVIIVDKFHKDLVHIFQNDYVWFSKYRQTLGTNISSEK